MRLLFWRHVHKWHFIHPPFIDYQERCAYAPAECSCGAFKDCHVKGID